MGKSSQLKSNYRIITNGEVYRIQQRTLWIFWTYCRKFSGSIYEFSTYNEAKEIKDKWDEMDRIEKLKWKVVE